MSPHRAPRAATDYDYALVGGGLQSALLVLALRARRPTASIALVEQAARLGGNHTWCFHAGDVSEPVRRWIEPLVVRSWDGYEVRFPDGQRVIEDGYCAISSGRLHDVVSAALGTAPHALLTAMTAIELSGDRVLLEDGGVLRARLVVDARGPATAGTGCGYQKFLGQELRLEHGHGLVRPVLMDARVEQTDGFRFFYLLPFAADRVLVEETRFSGRADLDAPAARAAIADYCRAQGWRVAAVEREETGILPMPWGGRTARPGTGVIEAGYRGGWFHPGTGYSLPVAARLADSVAREAPEAVREGSLRRLHREHTRQRRYCHLLNRLLFRWYPPAQRWRIFARFYRLPRPLIARFYALRLSGTDRIRLLAGRPPRGLSIRFRLESGVQS